MTHFVIQLAITVVVTCVVSWLLPKRQSAVWLAGFFVMAAIVDPRPSLISWLWVGIVVSPMTWAWAMSVRTRLEVAK